MGPKYFLVIARDSAKKNLPRDGIDEALKGFSPFPVLPIYGVWFPVGVQNHDPASSSEFFPFHLSPWYFVHAVPTEIETSI